MTVEQHRRNLFITLAVIYIPVLGLTALTLPAGVSQAGQMLLAMSIFAAPLSIIAAIVYWVKTTPIINRDELDGARVQMTPADLSAECQLRLSRLSNVTARVDGVGSTLIVTRTHFPDWAIAVAILFFPLGLLALLAKRTESTTLMFLEVEPPPNCVTSIRVGGDLTSAMAKALQFPFVQSTTPTTSSGTVTPITPQQPQGPTMPPANTPQPATANLPGAPIAPSPQAPAGWFPDPYGRYEQRYWDGTTWTNSVLVDGISIFEPGTV